MKKTLFLLALLLAGCADTAADTTKQPVASAPAAESATSVASTEESAAVEQRSTPVTSFMNMETLNMLAGTGQELYDQVDSEYIGVAWEDIKTESVEDFNDFLLVLSLLTDGVELEPAELVGNRVDFTFANHDGMSGENIVYAKAIDIIMRRIYENSGFGGDAEFVFRDKEGTLILALGVENP